MLKRLQRFFSVILTITMVLSMFPPQVLADWSEPSGTESTTTSTTMQSEVENSGSMEVSGVDTQSMDFEFSFISGRVTDGSGKGVSGVSVMLYNLDENTALTLCTTNNDGYWTTVEHDVIVGYTYIIRYYKAGYSFDLNNFTCLAESGTTNATDVTAQEIGGFVCNVEEYTYTTNDATGTATITGYTGTDTQIILPAELGGYSVAGIADNAFKGNTTLTGIAFSEKITSIGEYAFTNCTALKDVYLNNGLVHINRSAFNGCTALESIEIPNSVQTIGYRAFANCTKLSEIDLPLSWNSTESGIYSGECFVGCSSLKNVKIPEGMKTLPGLAFNGAVSLEEVTLPDTLKVIGEGAFSGCTGIDEFILSDSLITIGREAFAGCTGLTEIVLPDSVQTIGYRAFMNCTKLSGVTLPRSWNSTESGIYSGECFGNCPALTSITVPEGVTVLPDDAFSYATSLTEVILPSTLTHIGGDAFVGCTGLTGIDLPASLRSIGDAAFADCANITGFDLPDGLTDIYRNAFAGCAGLTEIVLPDSVQRIGYRAFYNCHNLESVTLPLSWNSTDSGIYSGSVFANCYALESITVPEGITHLPNDAFSNARYLKEIILPGTLKTIGDSAFYNCIGLTEIELPDGLTTINGSAFAGCTKLAAIDIPDSVTKIGYQAFMNCTGLRAVDLPVSWNSVASGIYSGNVFAGCTSLVRITVPEGMTKLPNDAFKGAAYLKKVTLPETLTSISENAFANCTYMTHFIVSDGVQRIYKNAFSNCSLLSHIWISESVTTIDSGAFANCSGFTIHGVAGSYAETYAKNNNIPFSTEPVVFELTTISGTVQDENGNGVPGVYVTVYDRNDKRVSVTKLITDETGKWSYDGFALGNSFIVNYYKAGWTFAENNFDCTADLDGTELATVTATELVGYVCNAEDYAYTTDDATGTATITGYTGGDTKLLLPAELGGYPVTGINNDVFKNNTTLTGIAFSENVTTIGEYAFMGCTSLIEVYLNNVLAHINRSSFNGCTALESIVIPDTVRTIGYRAFANSTKLSSVTLPRSWNSTESGIYSGECFGNCPALTSITVPEGVTVLPDDAFSYATSLTEVILPSTLTHIGGDAFVGCTGLTGIDLPASLRSIGDAAFADCANITGFDLPDGLTDIYRNAFAGCAGLTEIVLPDSVQRIGCRAFYNCHNLESVALPLSWNSTDSGIYSGSVFENCYALESITVPEGITHLPNDAFSNARYLKEIILPGTLKTIGDSAFYNCIGLTEIELPDGLTTINGSAFAGCTKLAAIDIPDSVTKIGYQAFLNCTALRAVDLPVSWNSTESGIYSGEVFKGCTYLVRITVPEGMTKLPNDAFKGAAYLKKVTLPETLTSISENAFANCTYMTHFIVSDGVQRIYKNAFNNCSSLSHVWISESVTTIDSGAFANCSGFAIHGVAGSYAETYAKNNNIPFSTEPVVFELTTISGTVQDENGNGVPGVYVTVYDKNDKRIAVTKLTTDENGTWLYDGFALGNGFIVNYYKAGWTFAENNFDCIADLNGTEIATVTATELIGYVCNAEDYAYTTDDATGTATITGYTGGDTKLLLPAELGGYPVTGINNDVFKNNTTLTGIAFSENVTTIGEYAFMGCTSLIEVYLNNVLAHINRSSFNGCTALESIVIPDTVRTIGYRAFANSTKLSGVTLPRSWNSTESGIYSGECFGNCPALTSITVPEGVTVLPDDAFSYATSLTEVILPSTLTHIGGYAFVGCTGLTGIDLPASLRSIGDAAFADCANITGFDLPDGLTDIYRNAFAGCAGLTEIVLPDSVQRIGCRAFYNCHNLESVTLPLSWNSTDSGIYSGSVFENCYALMSVTVPEGITHLPNDAFSNARYLKEIILPGTLKTIGDSAFYNCIGLTEIELPDGLTTINGSAFAGCTKLTEIDIPDSVTKIGYQAFMNCTGLRAVDLPVSWNSTESGIYSGEVFKGCKSLTAVTLPEGMTKLPADAFKGANYLRTIKLPESLTAIGGYAFNGCSQLRFVNVPENVTSIGSNVFENCPVLRYVLIENSNCTIGSNAFKNAPNMLLYCDASSLAAVYAIDNKIPYIASDANKWGMTGILDRTATSFFADANAINTTGYVSFTIDVAVSETDWETTSKRNVVVNLPANLELVETTLYVNGVLCTNYSYNSSTRRITIPVTQASVTVKYSARATADGEMMSYALFTYTKSNAQKQEVIGIMREDMDTLTLNATELTSGREITVEGAAPAESTVSIYMDGKLAATVQASKNGTYLADVTLTGTAAEQAYTIKAACGDLAVTKTVRYREAAPALTGFEYHVDGDASRVIDLYSHAKRGIRPGITHTGTEQPYKFVITFTNPGAIDTVYVTSTRSNIKKSIPAVYDAKTGTFVATGHFDGDNYLYVPGTLGIEYNLKAEDIEIGDAIDWSWIEGHLSNQLSGSAVVENGTIDLTEVSTTLDGVIIAYTLGEYDEAALGSLAELIAQLGTSENLYSYISGKYTTIVDLRDAASIRLIIVEDGADAWALTLNVSGAEDIVALGGTLSAFTSAGDAAYNTYGIMDDQNKLLEDIVQSSVVTDKSAALEKAEELATISAVFELMLAVLPVAFDEADEYALALNALVCAMADMSEFFRDQCIAQVKGESFRVSWHIDPSGYVYDAVTGERLEGVTATAYWIEFDDSADFWTVPPADTEYGVKWNSTAYNQSNPLTTDAEGRYAWDVPEGWWRVKYEKEGYQTTWSDWMPVPPPQTEVNIGMKPNKTELAVPTVTVLLNDNDKPVVRWDAVDGAEKYEVWRAIGDGKFTRLWSGTGTKMTNTSAVAGTTYSYKVRAVAGDTYSEYSEAVSIAVPAALAAPKATVDLNSNDKPVVRWDAVDGAEKYEVWRAIGDGKFTRLWSGTGTKMTNTSAVAGTTYSYKVRAVAGDTYSEYSEAVSIAVPAALAAPKATVDLNSNDKPVIRWNAVDGAEKYEVWRAIGDGKFTRLWSGTGTKMTNTSAVAGTTYSYKVRAVAGDTYSEYSEAVSIVVPAALAAPKATVDLNSNDKPVVRWDAVDGAEKYEVWRAVGNGEYTRLWTGIGTKMTNTSAEAGKTYSYKVRAVAGDTYSAYSEAVSIAVPAALAAPEATVDLNSNDKPVVRWNAVDGAEKYEVWRAVGNGEYTRLWTGIGTKVTNTSAEAGKTYSYKVRAVAGESYSKYSDPVTITLPAALGTTVLSASNNASSGKIVLKWDPIDGAERYEIYFSTSKTGEYTRLWTGSRTTVNHSSAAVGVTYYYKIRAVAGNAVGEFSEVESRTCDCARPVVTITRNSSGKPVLSWGKVEGAVKYEVYRSTSQNGEYSLLWSGTGTKMTNTSVKTGTTYYYKVKAICAVSSGNSAYSTVKSVTID